MSGAMRDAGLTQSDRVSAFDLSEGSPFDIASGRTCGARALDATEDKDRVSAFSRQNENLIDTHL